MLEQIKSVTSDSVALALNDRTLKRICHTEFEPRLTRSPGRSRHTGGSVYQRPLLNNDLTVSTFVYHLLYATSPTSSLPLLYPSLIRQWIQAKNISDTRTQLFSRSSSFFFFKEHFSSFPHLVYRSFGKWFVKVSIFVDV